MKYTDSIVEHIGLFDNNISNETEDFQICLKKIWEMSEFLTKIRYKMKLTFDNKKIFTVALEF